MSEQATRETGSDHGIGRVFRGRRLFLRVYLHGVLLLLASTATFIVVGNVFVRMQADAGGRRFGDFVAVTVCEAARRSPADLDAAVARSPLGISVYDPSSVVATSVSPPLPMPAVVYTLGKPRPRPVGPCPSWALACPGERGLVVVTSRPPPFHEPYDRLALEIGGVLIVLALGSLPFARSIVRPIERIVRAAEALGQGNLSARANVARRDEIGDLARAFDEMAARLEGMLRAEKELLANVSHELRTPMARIRVVLEATEEDPLLAQKYLPEIAIDLAELERLVEDVMTAARFDLAKEGASGEVSLPLRREEVDIETILRRSEARFAEMHAGRTLRLDLSAAATVPKLHVDPQLVRRVIDNLLDNAAKYSDSATAIDLHVFHKDERLVLEVIDRGIGIDEKDKDAVFSPFFRSDRSRSRKTGGVGLGLTLARRIVEGHAGELRLESRVGEGTTAIVELPLT